MSSAKPTTKVTSEVSGPSSSEPQIVKVSKSKVRRRLTETQTCGMVTESQSACRPEMTSETWPVGAQAIGPLSVKVEGTDLMAEPRTAAEPQAVLMDGADLVAESQSAAEPQAASTDAEHQPAELGAKLQSESRSVDDDVRSEPQSAARVDVTTETRPDGVQAAEPQAVRPDDKVDFFGLATWLDSKSKVPDSDDDDAKTSVQSETQTAETVVQTLPAGVSETQAADDKSETQSAQDELDAETTQSADAETQSVDGCKSMTGVTLVRFDGSVVPWGDRDDDDEDLWRMCGGPPPPDDESESDDDAQSKSDDERQLMNGDEMPDDSHGDAISEVLAQYYVPASSKGSTARLDDKATDRRDGKMTSDIRHEAGKLLEVPRRDASRRRRHSACNDALGFGTHVRAADHVQKHRKTRQHGFVQSKKGGTWHIVI